jgi:hypothetical protein
VGNDHEKAGIKSAYNVPGDEKVIGLPDEQDDGDNQNKGVKNTCVDGSDHDRVQRASHDAREVPRHVPVNPPYPVRKQN